jgi:hypothetical protein
MKKIIYLLGFATMMLLMSNSGCESDGAISSSGVNKATATVNTDANGNTVEQKDILERIKRDNLPGSIKHLYIISAYSGQVIIYSTVAGKVTSGNKRLNPSKICGTSSSPTYGFRVDFPGTDNYYYTDEVLGDDGAYGSSGDYIYWFDVKGVYHQHYVTGGQIIHISDQPLVVKNIIINMELTNEK